MSEFSKKKTLYIAEIIKPQSSYIFDNAVLKEISQCSNPQAGFNQIFIFESIFELTKIMSHRIGFALAWCISFLRQEYVFMMLRAF